jgi:putative ABC transport system substrate-binding protein
VIDRRTFLAGTGAVLLAAPLAAEAQHAGRVWRIGLLVPGLPPGCDRDSRRAVFAAFQNALRELGYVEMRNYIVVERCTVREGDEMVNAARDLIGQDVDVVIVGSNELAEALKKATSTVPVVFVGVADRERGWSRASPGLAET